MKKVIILSMALTCLYSGIQADNTESTATTAVDAQPPTEEVMQRHRFVRTQTFLNLLEKMKNGSEEDVRRFVAYTLDWMAELEKSDKTADQELFIQLKQIMEALIEKANNTPQDTLEA